MRFFTGIFLCIGLLLCLCSCSAHKTEALIIKEKPVKTEIVHIQEVDCTRIIPGVITQYQTVECSFKVNGTLETVYVQEGQFIKAGDTMALLADGQHVEDLEIAKLKVSTAHASLEDVKIQMEKAEVSYNQTLQDVENAETLYVEGALSEDAYQKIKLNSEVLEKNYESIKISKLAMAESVYEQAQIQLKCLEKDTASGLLIAPLEGVVNEVLVESGNQVKADETICILGSLEQEVKIAVSSDERNFLALGDPVKITDGKHLACGEITGISETMDETTFMYAVVIRLSGPLFPIHSLVNCELVLDTIEGIKVPINVIQNDGEPYVFKVDDGIARRAYIQIIGSVEEDAMIQGLNSGDEVIVMGYRNLRGGEKVIVEAASEEAMSDESND